MLKLFKAIVYAAAFVVNITTRICPVRRSRVVFISYFSDQPEGNYKAIADALSARGGFELVFLLRKYRKSLKGKLLHFLGMLRQAYHFNTASVVMLDGNCVVMKAIIRKKKTAVVQIWHACGAFKKFGEDTDGRLYRMRPCDYMITSCSKVIPIYSRALRIPEQRVMPLGSPRTDVLFSPDAVQTMREELYASCGIDPGQKLVLYAPTFRGSGLDETAALAVDLCALAVGLPDGFRLGVRLHPLTDGIALPDTVVDLKAAELMSALAAADMLITDYSSIVFDYAILERPMLFYVPDLEQYKKERGFYMDFESFVPGPVVKDMETLLSAIREGRFDIQKVRDLKRAYFDDHSGTAAKRVADFIAQLAE